MSAGEWPRHGATAVRPRLPVIRYASAPPPRWRRRWFAVSTSAPLLALRQDASAIRLTIRRSIRRYRAALVRWDGSCGATLTHPVPPAGVLPRDLLDRCRPRLRGRRGGHRGRSFSLCPDRWRARRPGHGRRCARGLFSLDAGIIQHAHRHLDASGCRVTPQRDAPCEGCRGGRVHFLRRTHVFSPTNWLPAERRLGERQQSVQICPLASRPLHVGVRRLGQQDRRHEALPPDVEQRPAHSSAKCGGTRTSSRMRVSAVSSRVKVQVLDPQAAPRPAAGALRTAAGRPGRRCLTRAAEVRRLRPGRARPADAARPWQSEPH